MKRKSFLIFFTLLFFSFSFGYTSCHKKSSNYISENNNISNKMKVTIGSAVFTATLHENVTATAFKTMLPLSINMIELNGNEKYYNLTENIPTQSSNPGTIKNGDLMFYGSNTLVLFYKTFSTSYPYTKLGQIDDTAGLASALGSGNVTVTFDKR